MSMRGRDPLVKPYLKWAGGKRQLLPQIKNHLPKGWSNMRYYEPFVGGGALFFDLQPRLATINDNNEQLILTYKVIRDNVDDLIELLNEHKAHHGEEYYYKVREQDRDAETFAKLTNVQKAARIIYLNKTCYNGLYRVNSQGLFNVPYGRYTKPAIFDEPILRGLNRYLNTNSKNKKIICGDFADSVKKVGKNSFIYFDPPYHSPNNTNFTGYQAGGFDENEQCRLQKVFCNMTDAGVKCLLSNSSTEFIHDLYNDKRFDIVIVNAKRIINSDSAGRGEVDEVLIKNWRE
jgi:DNA adenine methylase